METKMLVKLGVLFLVSPLHKRNFSVNEWDRGISQGFKTCAAALSGFFLPSTIMMKQT
jgi:hypothetical protein